MILKHMLLLRFTTQKLKVHKQINIYIYIFVYTTR